MARLTGWTCADRRVGGGGQRSDRGLHARVLLDAISKPKAFRSCRWAARRTFGRSSPESAPAWSNRSCPACATSESNISSASVLEHVFVCIADLEDELILGDSVVPWSKTSSTRYGESASPPRIMQKATSMNEDGPSTSSFVGSWAHARAARCTTHERSWDAVDLHRVPRPSPRGTALFV